MNDIVILGQQQQDNGSWVDVKIPKLKSPYEDELVPMTVERWNMELQDHRLTGTYRAVTATGGLFLLYILSVEQIVGQVEAVE